MHANYEQLLAIRDNKPVAAEINQHVDFCILCRGRLDEVTGIRDALMQLPVQHPRGEHWPEILERVEQERNTSHRQHSLRMIVGFGLAATLTLAVSLYRLPGIHPAHDQQDTTLVNIESQEQQKVEDDLDTYTGDTLPAATSGDATLDDLINRSRYLEAVLDSLPKRPRVMRAGTTDLITGLQDTVAMVDYQLNTGIREFTDTQTRQLWQQRIDLMNSLVYVRAAEAQQVAYIPN